MKTIGQRITEGPLVTSPTLMVSLAALAAMMPAILLPHKAVFRRDRRYWVGLILALTMSALVAADHLSAGWPRGVTPALWLTAATTLAVFLPVAAVTGAAWRLSVLLLPYVAAIGLLATLVDDPGAALARGGAWTGVHIAVSLVTYGLLTVAAAAGLAAQLQAHVLKTGGGGRAGRWAALLPAVAESERLEFRLLLASEVVLALGMASGVAVRLLNGAGILVFDHKTVLTIAAFAVIGALLLLHARSGTRGRGAARVVLLAYLLLTLAYPGVKFVSDFLI